MKSQLIILFSFFCFILSTNLFSSTHHVGAGQTYSTLTQAAAVTSPGDTILFHQGIYPGGEFVNNLQGNSMNWIYILALTGDTVIFDGGSSACQFSDGAYLHIRGFIFEHQTDNGVNMDDGGDYSTPSHHLIFDSCIFQDINATGNNDLLKMSGVDSFEIRNCLFLNGSSGSGDAIDMVGCHDGFIKNCRFENMGAASIQAKGGSRNIRIEANFFKNGGQRSLNLGGSTGMQYFRPLNAAYEAADLKVYSNIFIGSEAPIAYVGCINTEVINNTIYLPTHWALRILQENLDPQVASCGNNTFRNNIIFHDNQVTIDCNIGPNTLPATFTFSNNHWFHSQNSGWTGPSLPAADSNSIVGGNPLFVNEALENFALQIGSPDIAAGYPVTEPQNDNAGNNFNNPRSIGAFEGNLAAGYKVTNPQLNKIILYPNPFNDHITIDLSNIQISKDNNLSFHIFSLTGKEVFVYKTAARHLLTLEDIHLANGMYMYKIMQNDECISSSKLFVQY